MNSVRLKVRRWVRAFVGIIQPIEIAIPCRKIAQGSAVIAALVFLHPHHLLVAAEDVKRHAFPLGRPNGKVPRAICKWNRSDRALINSGREVHGGPGAWFRDLLIQNTSASGKGDNQSRRYRWLEVSLSLHKLA